MSADMPSITAATLRDRVVSLLARVPASTVDTCSEAKPITGSAQAGHVVIVATAASATSGSVSVRLDIGGDARRLRAFCAGCLSRSCGHALRVHAVFRAAAADDRIVMTRLLDAEGVDAISDDELVRRWQAQDAARIEAQAAARRDAFVAQRAAEARAQSQARAQGADLPLFAA